MSNDDLTTSSSSRRLPALAEHRRPLLNGVLRRAGLVAAISLMCGCHLLFPYSPSRSDSVHRPDLDGHAGETAAVDAAAGDATASPSCKALLGAPRVVLSDDFESYAAGDYPATTWQDFWSGVDAAVTDQTAFSGSKSFRLRGQSAWVRYDGVPFQSAGQSAVCYEARVMTTDPQKLARLGFAWKISANISGAFAEVTIGTTPIKQWHWVVVKVDLVDPGWQLWVDGHKEAPSAEDPKNRGSFTHFIVGTASFSPDLNGSSEVYFDDVKLYAEE